jgi:hypothetical protein
MQQRGDPRIELAEFFGSVFLSRKRESVGNERCVDAYTLDMAPPVFDGL